MKRMEENNPLHFPQEMIDHTVGAWAVMDMTGRLW